MSDDSRSEIGLEDGTLTKPPLTLNDLYELAARYVVRTANWGESDVKSLVDSLNSRQHEDDPAVRECRAFIAGIHSVVWPR